MSTKKVTLNPLWIISIFFSFTETMLSYAVFKTQDYIQVTLTIFVITFPTFVAATFFLIVWNKPKHLYAPTDYQDDQAFLDSFKEDKTANTLSDKIETAVNESLTSKKLLQDLKTGRKTEDVLKETAKTIVNKIKHENFITVDISTFTKRDEILTFSYDTFKTFNDLTNQIFFKLMIAGKISAYSYGYEWELKNLDTGINIKGARMITGTPKGIYLEDKRSLHEVGIERGAKLLVFRP